MNPVATMQYVTDTILLRRSNRTDVVPVTPPKFRKAIGHGSYRYGNGFWKTYYGHREGNNNTMNIFTRNHSFCGWVIFPETSDC